MTNVYYTSAFVPPELIAACGLTPHRLVPVADTVADSRREGVCSFAAAWLSALEQKQASGEFFLSVFSSACDQMRRSFDLPAAHDPDRTFLLNVPATTTEHALAYYKQELNRLAEFLCAVSGQSPDWTRTPRCTEPQSASGSARLRIAVVGESTPHSILTALQTIAAPFDAFIVDLTENTAAPETVTDLSLSPDPFDHLACVYFELPAIWKRPNEYFYQNLARNAHDHRVSGVIVLRHSFCDLWRTAKPEITRQLARPVLELDLDGGSTLSQWALSRLEAFMETLR